MSDQKPTRKEDNGGKSYYYAQVDFYLNAGEPALALYQASRNIAYNEEDPVAYINRARVYERLGKLENAIRDLAEAIRLSPDNEAAHSYLEKITEQAATAT